MPQITLNLTDEQHASLAHIAKVRSRTNKTLTPEDVLASAMQEHVVRYKTQLAQKVLLNISKLDGNSISQLEAMVQDNLKPTEPPTVTVSTNP